ncbi:hypothetical protein RF11_04055 [Thelohanellus kitauei]|uniref:Uncharacterized protein n=1 Tax=Thelohanellus kitauei TaxID=669202 RepID=A0A0C2J146_THEKT|nr:hypothetical protein RF11_04055 [Thelohanellus kitauei]
MDNFNLIHGILSSTTMILYVVYFWMLWAATCSLQKRYPNSRSVKICRVLRIITNVLSTMFLLLQIGGMFAFRHFFGSCKNDDRGCLEKVDTFISTLVYTQWLLVFSLMFNILICIFDANIPNFSSAQVIILITATNLGG